MLGAGKGGRGDGVVRRQQGSKIGSGKSKESSGEHFQPQMSKGKWLVRWGKQEGKGTHLRY